MDNYMVAGICLAVLVICAKCIDWILQEKTDREFRELISDILEDEPEILTEEQIFLEMEVIKEALIIAYEMDDDSKVKILGKKLNALREYKYRTV